MLKPSFQFIILLSSAHSPACRQAGQLVEVIMFFVYVLKSEKDGNLYIGMTNDLGRRLNEHNCGRNLSTKYRRPFRLIYSEKLSDRAQARYREKFLKSGIGREWIKNNL